MDYKRVTQKICEDVDRFGIGRDRLFLSEEQYMNECRSVMECAGGCTNDEFKMLVQMVDSVFRSGKPPKEIAAVLKFSKKGEIDYENRDERCIKHV